MLLSNLNDILNQANSMQITLAHMLKPIVIQALDFAIISISLWSFGSIMKLARYYLYLNLQAQIKLQWELNQPFC